MINWGDAYVQAATVGGMCTMVAAIIAWWASRRVSTRSTTQLLIDQLQEERAAIKTSLAAAHIKIDTLASRQRYWEDYVNELRSHIERALPPPPPQYPPGLLRMNTEGLNL